MFSPRNHIRMLLSACLAAAACLVVAPVASAKATTCEHSAAQAGQATKKQLVGATLCLLNKQRRAHHLSRLRLSKRLGNAAVGHSAEMSRTHYFSHNSLSGASFLDRIRRAGYLRRARRWAVGENIAWGTGRLSTPRSIVKAWMHSSGHRANILQRNFRQIGIGISAGAPVRSATR